MDYYIEMLQKCIARIEANFDFSAAIDHNTSKGTFREQIIKQFLRPFLPTAYGISGGQAFDKSGNISKQLDVVIYDSLHSYLAPYMDDFIYFPCESVYGNIEIKSMLNEQSFLEAVANIKSLKVLKREMIETYYVNPIKKLQINNIKWDITATNEYFGIIFAYDSVKSDNVLGYLREYVIQHEQDREFLPNIIILFKEKRMICRCHKCDDGMIEMQPLKNFEGYISIKYDIDILTIFILNILIMVRSIELKAMNIETLVNEVNKKALSNIKGIVPHIIL